VIKIIVVAHGELAQELVSSVEVIAGKQSNLYTVKRSTDDNLAQMRERVGNLLRTIEDEDGSLILTDMKGGTPCNASAQMIMCFNVEVLSGVNLPMVLSAVYSSRSNISVSDLAEKVLCEGQKSIVNIKKVLSSKMKENG